MIKAIIFDLGGVVFTNGTKQFIEWLNTSHGIEKHFSQNLLEGESGSAYRAGTMTRDDFWDLFRKTLNIAESAGVLEQKWMFGYELIDETLAIIKELGLKYKIYYLSDTVEARVDWLNKKYNFLSWFTDGIFSHEVGVRKPNPKVYSLILKKTGVRPDEVIYIDDKSLCLSPATEMGMKTILFQNPRQLRKKLQKLQIL